MPKKFNSDSRDAMLSPKRRDLVDPEHVISMIPLRPYHKVVDIGCGPGYFAVPLAKYVNQGKLYALDIQKEMLETCRERISAIRLGNVEVLKCGQNKLPLDKDSVDGAFIAFVLHEATDKKGFLAEAERLLQRGGWLAVLEWYKKATEEGPPLKERVSEEEVKELGEKAGLRFVSQRDLNGKNYLMLFRK
ncbi:methyltransferase domain-containing protein [SAR202 cluster bacterium AC-647-N09_OGT_505m]|nr:methyltransferase domain-containing protein [SAR202 cluster bacterium AC-647-N09_OGT_505m]